MNISMILVHPQIGENIGASARAMLNFGFHDLRVVAPRDGWPNQRAIDMAAGAFEKMPRPGVFDTLEAAIADCHYAFATTARERDMTKPVCSPTYAATQAIERHLEGQNIAFVFGAERTGMTNDQISLCQSLIHIPTNPEFSSLNLGQAVLLVAHELRKAQDSSSDTQRTLPTGGAHPVAQDQLSEFFKRLETELERGKFFRAKDLRPTMIRNIRNIFTRADLTDQEVKTLHGIISALIGNKTNKKAAD